MRYSEFTEARRGLEKNPKRSAAQEIGELYDDIDETVAGTKNLFVSFTSLDKLGINPRSTFNTPLGIYSYPAEYILDTVSDNELMTALPYAGEKPWANVFSVNPQGIIELVNMTKDQEQALYVNLRNYLKTIRFGGNAAKIELDAVLGTAIHNAPDKAMRRAEPGGRFWYVTMIVSQFMAPLIHSRESVAWNSLFRSIGITGAVDMGLGIIHSNEPTQAVFFDSTVIKDVHRFANKYAWSHMKNQERHGQSQHRLAQVIRKELSAMTPEQQVRYIYPGNRDYIRFVNDPRVRAMILKQAPHVIEYLPRPTLHDQITSLTADPSSIKSIVNPNARAVEYLLKHIETSKKDRAISVLMTHLYNKPPESIQLVLIKDNPYEFFTMQNPTQRTLSLALAELKKLPRPMGPAVKQDIINIAKTHNLGLPPGFA